MNWHRLRRPRLPWALALGLALLLLSGWGQVHRVLHPGVTAVHVLSQSPSTAHSTANSTSGSPLAAVHLGHEAEGGLCLLLDHLAEGSAALLSPVLALAGAAPATLPQSFIPAVRTAQPRPFDARGPPRLA